MKNEKLLFCTLFIANIIIFLIYSNNMSKIAFCILISILIILMILFYFLLKKLFKKNYSVEKMFLFISILMGFLYMVLIPFNNVMDEETHFLRAYEISEGKIYSSVLSADYVGGYFNESINNMTSACSNLGLKRFINFLKNGQYGDSHRRYEYGNTAVYTPVCYIPQTVGIFIGRTLNLPIYLIMLCGRFFNYISYIIIIYFAIKIFPYNKMILCFIALMPLTLQQGVSLSADSLTISISFLLLSYSLYLKYKDGMISNKEIFLLILLSVIISLCKIVYLPFCLITLIIPQKKIKNKKIIYLLTIIFICFINIAWLKSTSKFNVTYRFRSTSTEQLLYVLSNPFTFLITLFRSYESYGYQILYELFGRSLGFNTFKLAIFYVLGSILIYCEISMDKSKYILSKKEKILIIFILLSITILMSLALYMQMNDYKNNTISFIIGRYFIPFLPFIYLLFNKKTKMSINYEYVYIFLVFMELSALFNSFTIWSA